MSSGPNTREGWLRLALIALEQADVSPDQLAIAYRHGRGRTEDTLFELHEGPLHHAWLAELRALATGVDRPVGQGRK